MSLSGTALDSCLCLGFWAALSLVLFGACECLVGTSSIYRSVPLSSDDLECSVFCTWLLINVVSPCMDLSMGCENSLTCPFGVIGGGRGLGPKL